jgi:putative ABC transport system substrate-binding protein
MRRRELITLIGGAAAAWPLAARAQQVERIRRIGVLLPAAADDSEFQARLAAFHQGLALLGWSIGRNVRIDTRWATANSGEIRRHAAVTSLIASGEYPRRWLDVDCLKRKQRGCWRSSNKG